MKKSFATPSNKPVDVEYRLKRLRATLNEATMFLGAIDPSVDPDRHLALHNALITATDAAAAFCAPAKKARKSADEKAAAAAAKAAAKEEAAKAKAAAKAEKAAAKRLKAEAASIEVESNDDGTVTVKTSKPKPIPTSANVATDLPVNSAIARALAAAKARKAAKAAAA